MNLVHHTTYDNILYLTNGACENAYGSEELFRQHGLPWGEFGEAFYPLTDDEQRYIGDSLINVGGYCALLGYSVLVDGVKYLAPTFEVDWCAVSFTESQAEAENRAIRPLLAYLALQTGGQYFWSDEPTIVFDDNMAAGRYEGMALIPFSYARQHANTFEEWILHLQQLARTINPITVKVSQDNGVTLTDMTLGPEIISEVAAFARDHYQHFDAYPCEMVYGSEEDEILIGRDSLWRIYETIGFDNLVP